MDGGDNPYVELCHGAGNIALAAACHVYGYIIPLLTLFLLIGGCVITAHSLLRILRRRPVRVEPPQQP
jgi:hypothetical protein